MQLGVVFQVDGQFKIIVDNKKILKKGNVIHVTFFVLSNICLYSSEELVQLFN